jgi:peptide chain release factor
LSPTQFVRISPAFATDADELPEGERPCAKPPTAREERSQAMNKKLALARLAGLLAAGAEAAQADAERDRWAHHDALERGRPVRTFEGPSFRERR